MARGKEYKDDAMAAIQETAEGLHHVGVLDKKTMREFDELCLTPVRELTPDDIRGIREREHVSQTVFARHLNVGKGLVSQWERGEKRPAGPSLKLLALVDTKGLDAILSLKSFPPPTSSHLATVRTTGRAFWRMSSLW